MALKLSTGLKNELLAQNSLREAMGGATGFHIDIYSGTRPSSPDNVPNGTKLVTVSDDGGAGGLTLETSASNGTIQKTSGQTWSGTVVASGVAGWFRARLTTDTGTGASTTELRIDGIVGASGADLNMTTTSMTVDEEYTTTSAQFRF